MRIVPTQKKNPGRRRVLFCAIVAVSLAASLLFVESASAAPPPSLNNEMLAWEDPFAAAVNVDCDGYGPDGSGGHGSYTASGEATGPYPGTFTESGTFTVGHTHDPFDPGGFYFILDSFEATFTIVSGPYTITGTKTLSLADVSIGTCGSTFRQARISIDFTARIDGPEGVYIDHGGGASVPSEHDNDPNGTFFQSLLQAAGDPVPEGTPTGDGDGDGVVDTIDDNGAGAGAFRDGISGLPDTVGAIVSVPAGLSVVVADAADPDGVSVVVSGTGTARVTLSVCGFTAQLGAGSSVVFTCGSVHARVVTGSVDVVLPDGGVVKVPSGGDAIVSIVGGSPQVNVVAGTVSVVAPDGTTTSVVPGPVKLLCRGRVATIVGTTGNNTINAGSGNDVIVGLGGNDTINAGSGNDLVCAGSGNDTIDAGSGNDYVDAGDGTNRVNGGSGADVIRTGSGNDTIDGGSDNDVIDSGGGTNVINAGSGDDKVTAGAGNDTIDAGDGNDDVIAGAGNDVISAGSGNDKIDGGDNNDNIDGGTGNDTIDGGSGNDTINGGSGNDTINGGSGTDTINGGSGTDRCDGGSGQPPAPVACE